ncbi:MAG TPA: hypothetical protein VFO76_08895 [Candidatus Kapabacteria bacterium]|nr:hypothetical protein [Candidatus Kapabacteria bacterium]
MIRQLHSIALSTFLLFGLTLVSCNSAPKAPAELNGMINLKDLSGSATDGTEATKASPEDHQYHSPKSVRAEDGASKAISDAPEFDHVSTNVAAIAASSSTAPAMAQSNNRVETGLDINTDGTYHFKATLAVKGVKLEGKSTMGFYVRANILDKTGLVIPQGALLFKDIIVSGDYKQAIVGEDTAHPIAIDGNGNFTTTFTIPDAGMTMKKGTYYIGLILRVAATAETPSSKAIVSNAVLSIAVS